MPHRVSARASKGLSIAKLAKKKRKKKVPFAVGQPVSSRTRLPSRI